MESLEYDTYGLGDIVLFGNGKRMKVDCYPGLGDIFLDYRVKNLMQCFSSLTGWKRTLESMSQFLQDPEKQYFSEIGLKSLEEFVNEKHSHVLSSFCMYRRISRNDDHIITLEEYVQKLWINIADEYSDKMDNIKSFMTLEQFVKKTFCELSEKLKFLIQTLYTQLPKSFISLATVKKMFRAIELLRSIGISLGPAKFKQTLDASEKERIPSCFLPSNSEIDDFLKILSLLSSSILLPELNGRNQIEKFCLSNACLVLCTVSSSIKLYTEGMTQLPGLQHCILIGDEKQLPALVKSKIADSCGFGRSMFERLVILGYKKHMLNVQYRMHPNISLFPSKEFYDQKISDAPFVMEESYNKSFLEGELYSSYSFINIAKRKEKSGRGHSLMNMVEVAVISEMIKNLKKEFKRTQEKVIIGVISPYNAQVYAIQDKIKEYTSVSDTDFSVSVRSIGGFQGGEEDIIIMSTVRSNGSGKVGFLSNRQRTNVAMTRESQRKWMQPSQSMVKNRAAALTVALIKINQKKELDKKVFKIGQKSTKKMQSQIEKKKKQCINEDVEKDDINDEIQEDDINDKIQEDDLNDKIQEDDIDDEFQEDDIDLDDEFQEEDIDGEFQEDDVDEEFMEDDISNEFQEDDLDALLLEDKLE
ncbi:unnamed protein product [Vicia faba]|uniref:DNA2/NAM7 helicase-like C-terminal domain-containing protein n=2 Tax=Vicia faba TaxID=3906 RepID=A0AAV0YET7_VICFA|nr:unnamed protein product [Vicia faba]